MKQFLEKHETATCVTLIVTYLVLNSFCLQNLGSTSLISAIANTVLSVGVLALIIILDRRTYYGLTRVNSWKKYLFFIPLLLISSCNFWGGIRIQNPASEIIFHIIFMANVGFLEEILFRGFLFKILAKKNLKSAMIISALTFGAGHILSLFIGKNLVETLIQICYACSTGYLFVLIFHKSKSLWPCILAHIVINASSIFAIKSDLLSISLISPIILFAGTLIYAVYIQKTVKEPA